MVSVLDASAVLEVRRAANDPASVYEWLTEEVRQGRVALPTMTSTDVRRLTQNDDIAAVWATAVSSQRARTDAAIEYRHYVVATVSDLLDPDQGDTCHIYVAAQAHELVVDKVAVEVVTEDVQDTTRISLRTACERLGVGHIQVRPWLERNGHTIRH